VKLAELVATSRAVAGTRARLAKLESLGECLKRLSPAELPVGVAWLSGELPQGRIGVGYAAIRRAMEGLPADAEGVPPDVLEVDAELSRIASLEGKGSQTERARSLRALFARCGAAEREFLAPLLAGELRQGALEGLMAEAVARASGQPSAEVRRALMVCGSLGPVARAAFERGAEGLAEFRLELFRPLQPMLAQTAADPAEALAALGGRCAFEWKLDGARVQIHRANADVRIFTRGLLDATGSAPDLVEWALAVPARSFVLDGEAMAFRADGRPQPFQVTMSRFGRRLDVEAQRGEMPLAARIFDVLHLDGEDLIGRTAEERWRILDERISEVNRIPRLVTGSEADAAAFLESALAAGHEGVMAKALDAPYEAGRRGAAWLKLKPVHTLDLVVLAVERGSGRRKGFLSNLHLGARDPATGGFVMLGKTFKGMTDELLAWQTKELGARAISEERHVVYVRPELVVEIAFDGVQASTQYPGGVALRFARVKGYRPDKRPDEADTIDTVRGYLL
jgi:DNA ligase-1